jgi:hypothetical protein
LIIFHRLFYFLVQVVCVSLFLFPHPNHLFSFPTCFRRRTLSGQQSPLTLFAPPNGFRSCGIANGSWRWWWFVCCPCEEKQHQPPPPFPMLLSVVVGCCDEVWASGGGVVNRSTSRNPRRIFGR